MIYSARLIARVGFGVGAGWFRSEDEGKEGGGSVRVSQGWIVGGCILLYGILKMGVTTASGLVRFFLWLACFSIDIFLVVVFICCSRFENRYLSLSGLYRSAMPFFPIFFSSPPYT